MYLLKFLQKTFSQADAGLGNHAVEYRLACSAEFYNVRVITCDWRKSDITRVLLKEPFELFVASQPFESYPQELCLRFKLPFVTESEESASMTFLPDDDIVEDLCSMMSLLSRRLVSPVCKTRQSGPNWDTDALGSLGSDYPSPILPLRKFAAWDQRPLTVVTGFQYQEIINNSPPPVGVDPYAFSEFLVKLPSIADAIDIVHASRLYRTALELIESRPDIAYQLLISTVESLANVAFPDFEATESDKLAAQEAIAVQRRAKDYGLDDHQAKELALESSKGNRWLKKKFKKFLLDFTSSDELAGKDPVFPVPEYVCPNKEDIPKVFGRIYDARSVNLHRAFPFPGSVGIGTKTSISWRQMPGFKKPPEIPPAPWFERAVSFASRQFLNEKSGAGAKPFVEYAPKRD